MTKRERLFDAKEFGRILDDAIDRDGGIYGIETIHHFIDSEIRRQIKAFSEEITVGYKANHWKSDTPMSDAINTALKLREIKP